MKFGEIFEVKCIGPPEEMFHPKWTYFLDGDKTDLEPDGCKSNTSVSNRTYTCNCTCKTREWKNLHDEFSETCCKLIHWYQDKNRN